MKGSLSEEKKSKEFSIADFYRLFDGVDRECESHGFENDAQRADFDYFMHQTTLTGTLPISASKISLAVPDGPQWGPSGEGEKPVFIDFSRAKNVNVYYSSDYSQLCTEAAIDFGSDIARDLRAKEITRVKHAYWQYEQVCSLMVFKNGEIYRRPANAKGKYRPAPFRDVVGLLLLYHGEPILEKIMQIPAVKDSYVMRDLVADFRFTFRKNFSFPSLLWNQCLGYKNRNHLMRSLYKDADDIDFNKFGIPAGYAYMKTRPYVDDGSQGILYNAFTHRFIKGYKCDRARAKSAVARSVVGRFLWRKFHATDTNSNDIEVEDYVRNALTAKVPLNLRFNSIRKVQQASTDLALVVANKTTAKIIVPKNSKFEPLAKALPSDFERIKTKRRIVIEGTVMRHCVASYADWVNKDKCAIYHLDYEGHGYTIEFRRKGRRFVVNQIQSKADRGAPEEVWKYVNRLIYSVRVA